MFLLIDGTPGSDISDFLARLQEETLSCTIMPYEKWITRANFDHTELACNDHHEHAEGIVFMRVLPEIAHKRLHHREKNSSISLDYIKHVYTQKEEFFIENKNTPQQLQHLPVLVLNGNIDFQSDFSQFYNHLFYIRRFVNDIQKRKDIAQGTYQEKIHHRCC